MIGGSASVTIATADGVSFRLPLAGPMLRAMAYTIDLLVIMVLANIAMFLGAFFQIWVGASIGAGVQILGGFVIQIGYGIACESAWHGRTIGKRVCKLRVMDDRALRLRFSQVVVRNLLRVIDSLPAFYLIGGISTLLNKRCQRLGDLAAGTIVVRTAFEAADLTAPPRTEPSRHNPWQSRPDLEARLRQLTDPVEIALLLHALRRREELDPAARLKLFGEIRAHFATKTRLPDELVFGLTDEQCLRDLAEALTRRPRILAPPPIRESA